MLEVVEAPDILYNETSSHTTIVGLAHKHWRHLLFLTDNMSWMSWIDIDRSTLPKHYQHVFLILW